MELLGSRIGLLKPEDDGWVCERAAKQQPLLDAIAHPTMPVLHAMHMLRSSATPTMHYISRVTPPRVAIRGLKAFDAVLDTVCKKLHLTAATTEDQHRYLHLPVKLG